MKLSISGGSFVNDGFTGLFVFYFGNGTLDVAECADNAEQQTDAEILKISKRYIGK